MMKEDPSLSPDDNGSDNGFDNFLSAQLKQAQPYLMDDVFTAQVMTKLPPVKKLSVWQERLIIVVPLLIISVLVISQFSILAVIIKLWALVFSVGVANLLSIALAISAVVLCGASYWFAKQVKLI